MGAQHALYLRINLRYAILNNWITLPVTTDDVLRVLHATAVVYEYNNLWDMLYTYTSSQRCCGHDVMPVCSA